MDCEILHIHNENLLTSKEKLMQFKGKYIELEIIILN